MYRWLVFTALLMIIPVSGQFAIAAEVRVEGVLKAINLKERTLLIEKLTPKGKKDVLLEVAGEVGNLSALKAGDAINVLYDSTLEVVTKLIRSDTASVEVEIVAIKELGVAGHPWLTRDGLTIYFSAKPSDQKPSAIWMARRETSDSLFKNPIQVTLGLDSTFSDDGLEGILFLPEEGKGTLQFVRRKNISDDFSRPTMIKELATTQSNEKRAFLVCPGLSADGLTLYCENIGQGVIFCTRTKFGAPWSKPKKLPIVIGDEGYHRYPFVTDDGLWLFCTNTEIRDHKTANIALYARNTISEPFVFKGYLYAGEVPLNGEFARFIPATKELFFANRLDGKTRIFAVKNFDPSIAVKEP